MRKTFKVKARHFLAPHEISLENVSFFHFLLLFIFLAHSSLKKIVTFNSFGQRLLFVRGKNCSWFMMPRKKRQTWINTKGTITQVSIKFCGWKEFRWNSFAARWRVYVQMMHAKTQPISKWCICCYPHYFMLRSCFQESNQKMFGKCWFGYIFFSSFWSVSSWFPIEPKTIFDAMNAKWCWYYSLNENSSIWPRFNYESRSIPTTIKPNQINSNVYSVYNEDAFVRLNVPYEIEHIVFNLISSQTYYSLSESENEFLASTFLRMKEI